MKRRLITLALVALAVLALTAAPAQAQTCDPNQQPICISGLEPYTGPIYQLLGQVTVRNVVKTALTPRTACVPNPHTSQPICVTISGWALISEHDVICSYDPDPSSEYYYVEALVKGLWNALTDCSTPGP